VNSLRRQWLVTSICCDLGPRAVYEFICKIGKHGFADLNRRLGRYAEFAHDQLELVGDDRFPAPPIHLVVGGDDS
jgi:hypothetical protein